MAIPIGLNIQIATNSDSTHDGRKCKDKQKHGSNHESMKPPKGRMRLLLKLRVLRIIVTFLVAKM